MNNFDSRPAKVCELWNLASILLMATGACHESGLVSKSFAVALREHTQENISGTRGTHYETIQNPLWINKSGA